MTDAVISTQISPKKKMYPNTDCWASCYHVTPLYAFTLHRVVQQHDGAQLVNVVLLYVGQYLQLNPSCVKN